MAHIIPPRYLEAFSDAKLVKSKTSISNGNGKRKRWECSKYIYEWDYQHGTVEKYSKNGKHLGEYHPLTGKKLKPADPRRTIEP
jgi:hypothetical protein